MTATPSSVKNFLSFWAIYVFDITGFFALDGVAVILQLNSYLWDRKFRTEIKASKFILSSMDKTMLKITHSWKDF